MVRFDFTECRYVLLLILIVWELIWKIIAGWRAARNGQKAWYICIMVLNTAGILSIIYLLTHPKGENGKSI